MAPVVVRYRGNWFDVSSFLEEHPGGPDLILPYNGKDVEEIMSDPISHKHSQAAYEILREYILSDSGSVAKTLPSSKEDFLDLNQPLLYQVWSGGFSKAYYLDRVHRPRHYALGSPRIFASPLLEPLSKTPWYVVPTIWFPMIALVTRIASHHLPPILLALFWFTGLFLCTLIEYGMHRFLFHIDDWLPDNRVSITLHFLLHGVHHFLPMDHLRLVMPPTLLVVLSFPFYRLAHLVFPYYPALAVFAGGICGYVLYDMTHYFLHHKRLPSFFADVKSYHLRHHYENYEAGFGVTSRFWDNIFGTALVTLKTA